MLWVAIRLPWLPLEVFDTRKSANGCLAVEQNKRVLMATNGATSLGIKSGMKSAMVSALVSDENGCDLRSRDPEKETEVLNRLASWAYSHTPYIQRYQEDTLLLEVSRCLRLFGSVENLIQELSESLDHMPYSYQLGMAHTGKGAWLLSFQNHELRDKDSHTVFVSRLRESPLELLTEQETAVSGLKKMGLTQLGEVADLPSAALGKRFGQAFQTYLQELMGGGEKPPTIYQANEHFCRQVPFAWPVVRTDLLELPAKQLLQQLVDYLVRQQLQCQEICWHFYSPQGEKHSIEIGCERVHRHWELLFDLTRIRLEQLQLDFEVEMLELECSKTSPVDLGSESLFAWESARIQGNVESLVAKLQTRMGRKQLYQVQVRAEHLPELAQTMQLPFDSEKAQKEAVPRGSRPCWLLSKPQPLRRSGNLLYWNDQQINKTLKIIDGPERIEGYWWSQPEARDYFIARRDDSVNCWVYRELNDKQNWYAQGVFA
jgi:protein ImuB